MPIQSYVPNSVVLQGDGRPSIEWLLWFSNPIVTTLTVHGGFGTNGTTPQTSFQVNAAVPEVAGAAYTAVEQAMLNDLKALVNQMRSLLIANGQAV